MGVQNNSIRIVKIMAKGHEPRASPRLAEVFGRA